MVTAACPGAALQEQDRSFWKGPCSSDSGSAHSRGDAETGSWGRQGELARPRCRPHSEPEETNSGSHGGECECVKGRPRPLSSVHQSRGRGSGAHRRLKTRGAWRARAEGHAPPEGVPGDHSLGLRHSCTSAGQPRKKGLGDGGGRRGRDDCGWGCWKGWPLLLRSESEA